MPGVVTGSLPDKVSPIELTVLPLPAAWRLAQLSLVRNRMAFAPEHFANFNSNILGRRLGWPRRPAHKPIAERRPDAPFVPPSRRGFKVNLAGTGPEPGLDVVLPRFQIIGWRGPAPLHGYAHGSPPPISRVDCTPQAKGIE